MLAMADRQGRVWASIPGLANRARVPVEDTEKALATFLAPDKYSRTPDHDGRRIEPIDGGWRLLNHAKYRDIRDQEVRAEQNREAQAKYREKVSKSADNKPTSAQAEAYTDTDTDTNTNTNTKSKAMRSHGSRLPPDWLPSEPLKAWASEKRPDLDLDEVLENFKDYWKAATKNATKRDWDAAFRTWVRGQRVSSKPALQAVPPAGTRPSIVCTTCRQRVFTWTGSLCDPCWRKSQGKAA